MTIPTLGEMKDRVRYRLRLMLEHALMIGVPNAHEIFVHATDVHGFTLAQVAELQARCDYLDHQVRELQAQIDGEIREFQPLALVN